ESAEQLLEIPQVWLLDQNAMPADSILEKILAKADTVLFPSASTAAAHAAADSRGIIRLLPAGVDWDEIKLYRQQTSPILLRQQMNIPKDAVLITSCGGDQEIVLRTSQ